VEDEVGTVIRTLVGTVIRIIMAAVVAMVTDGSTAHADGISLCGPARSRSHQLWSLRPNESNHNYFIDVSADQPSLLVRVHHRPHHFEVATVEDATASASAGST
jgi:hypothetical protein